MLLLVVLASPAIMAQTPRTDTLYLTWDEVAARVSAASPELMRQRVEIQSAEAERVRAASVFPSLPELEYSYVSDASFKNDGEGDWEAGLSQEIEIAGQRSLRRAAADAQVAYAEHKSRGVELALRAQARIALSRLIAAESRMRLMDSLAQFARRLDTIAGRLLAALEISELDRNLMHIERTGAEIDLVKAEGARDDARIELAQLLGVDRSTVIVVPMDAAMPSPTTSLDSAERVLAALGASDDAVLRRRADWLALDQSAERVRLNRDLAGRAWVPNIRLGVSLRNETTVFGPDAITGASDIVKQGFGTLRSDDRLIGLHVGLGVPLPFGALYDLGQADRAAADAELDAIDAERQVFAAKVHADVERNASRLRAAARAAMLYTIDIAPLVERNLTLLERGYAAGELSATEVITQSDRLVRTRESMIETHAAFTEALAEFEQAIGE